MASFQEFFKALIENGTIPYGGYAISADNNGYGSGDVMIINSPDFMTKCLKTYLIDILPTEGACAVLSNLYNEVILTFKEGKWQITRNWIRPKYES